MAKKLNFKVFFRELTRIFVALGLIILLILLFSSVEIDFHVTKHRNSLITDISSVFEGVFGIFSLIKQ